ncbi:MAG: hypothetical protein NTY09_02810 [bacterium]|nr:hypothetical protein [bacterium]
MKIRLLCAAVITGILIGLCFLSCNKNQEEPDLTGDSASSLGNINVNTELEQIIEKEDGSGVPEALLFKVTVENADSVGTDEMGVNFVYDMTVPTGETTYLRENPTDESSGFKSDENGPILFDVVSQQTDRLEDWGPVAENVREFYVILPENAYSIRYHIEVEIPTSEQELVLYDSPKVEVGDIMEQGGLIQELPE